MDLTVSIQNLFILLALEKGDAGGCSVCGAFEYFQPTYLVFRDGVDVHVQELVVVAIEHEGWSIRAIPEVNLRFHPTSLQIRRRHRDTAGLAGGEGGMKGSNIACKLPETVASRRQQCRHTW